MNTVTDAELATIFSNIMGGDIDAAVVRIETNLTMYRTLMPECSEAISRLESTARLLKENSAEYKAGGIGKFVEDVAKQHEGKPAVGDQYSKIIADIRKNREERRDPKIKSLLDNIGKNLDAMN